MSLEKWAEYSWLRREPTSPAEIVPLQVGRLFIEPIEMLYAVGDKNDDALSKLRGRRKKHTASRDKAGKVQ